MPFLLCQLRLKLVGVIEDLNDLVGAAIFQFSRCRGGLRLFQAVIERSRLWLLTLIDEENTP